MIKFLLDECMNLAAVACLAQAEPSMEVLAVGQPGAPPHGTLDPDLLIWAEQNEYILVTRDKKSMPGHISTHQAGGRHTCGVVLIRASMSWQQIADDLLLIWSATTVDYWRDRLEWIPL
jgi:predicted nuclease of predicted toxin-antitoxin system